MVNGSFVRTSPRGCASATARSSRGWLDEVGLDPAEVEESLGDQRFESAVRQDEAEARSLGISGVRFFLVDRKLAVSGAQSVDVLRQMLEKASSR